MVSFRSMMGSYQSTTLWRTELWAKQLRTLDSKEEAPPIAPLWRDFGPLARSSEQGLIIPLMTFYPLATT